MLRRVIPQLMVLLLATVCGGSLPAEAMTPAANIEWMHQFGSFVLTPVADQAADVAVYGDLYVVEYKAAFAGADVASVYRRDRQGNEVWYRQFGNRDTYAFGVAADSSGIYVVGQTGEALPGQTWLGVSDIYLRKYDVAGNEIWTRQFGTPNRDEAADVAVDSTGVYVVGRTCVALPNGSGSCGMYPYILKYDVDGNEIWMHQFGSLNGDYAYGVAVDSSGVYVVGETQSALPGQTNAGGYDAYIRKYDVDGNELWTSQFGSQSHEEARDVAADGSSVYVVGRTIGSLPGQTSAGGTDAFVRKYDMHGNEIWTRQFGSQNEDRAYSIGIDSSNVYVGGNTYGALPGQTSVGNQDAYVRKYDKDGNELWTHQFGSSAADIAYAVAIDSAEVFVAGSTSGVLPGQTSSGQMDIFLRDYDASGNELWTTQFGRVIADSRYADSAGSIAVNDGIYVVGDTGAALTGQTSAGSQDAYLRKYGMDGSEAWVRQFGTPEEDGGTSVAASGSDVYVVGNTRGALPQQTNAGRQDIYIRKYDSAGNEAWTRQFGSSADDKANGVITDSSGVYIVGNVQDALPGQTFVGPTEVFVRKYDLAGSEIWTRQTGANGGIWNSGIASGSSGIYVVGSTNGSLLGQTSAGGLDAFVRKYDADGNETWARQFGTTGADRAIGVAVDSSGIYVLTELNHPIMGFPMSVVRKYDADGNEAWTQEFGLADGTYARGLAVDGTAVYVTGGTLGAFDGQLSAGGWDGFVLKFGLDGVPIWAKQFGTSESDWMNGIALAESGVYVAGEIGDYYLFKDAVVLKLSKEAVLFSFLYLPTVNR